MNRRVLLLVGLVALAAIPTIAALWLASVGSEDDASVVVFAPSSLASVQAELDDALAEAGIGPVDWVFSGSQSLVAQLVDGAPADALITADDVTYAAAVEAGVTWPATRELTTNSLVLAVAAGNPGSVADLGAIGRTDLLIGLCAPEVPCGRLAVDATTTLGVTPAPDTEEASARALAAKLASGEIDAALVYRTDALARDLEIVEVAPLAEIRTTYLGSGNAEGQPVIDFLASNAGREVLTEAGFGS